MTVILSAAALCTTTTASAQRSCFDRGREWNGAEPLVLTAKEREALDSAIQDEYKARATYLKVLDTFGEVRPFSNIVHAESRHVEALKRVYAAYGLDVPEDTWYDRVPTYDTLADACAAAIDAELENAALYEEIVAGITNPDVLRVFSALHSASLEHHLPAFQRCLDRTTQGRWGRGRGPGMGQGRGRGRGMGRGYGCGQGNCRQRTWDDQGRGRL
jgi:hypothetical protein